MKSNTRGVITTLVCTIALVAGAFATPVFAASTGATATATARHSHAYQVEKAQYEKFLESGPVRTAYYRVGPHTYANFSAEKPVVCSNPQTKARQADKWAAFCANGGGGR